MYRWQLDLPRNDPRKPHADHLGERVALNHDALPDALTCGHHNMQAGARAGNRERARIRGERERESFPRAYARDARNDGLPCW